MVEATQAGIGIGRLTDVSPGLLNQHIIRRLVLLYCVYLGFFTPHRRAPKADGSV